MEDRDVNDVVYLYGVVPADAPAPPAALRGLGDAAVRLLPVGEVAAAVANLPAAEWAGDRVESRFSDMGWVGEQGLAHERVVLWFVDHTDILPARLFSLHSDEAALTVALEERMPAIRRNFAALASCREWNLKVGYDAAALGRRAGELSEPLRQLEAQITDAPPGRRYLLERSRGETLKRELRTLARSLADSTLDALRPHAQAVRILPLAPGDDSTTVVMTAALLVHTAAEADLQAEADRITKEMQERGMIIGFSGPWAPYRFMEQDVDV